ncbi:NAD(+) synthase [Desulfosporosinus sp. BICA1-9]|uniref:NAD(+) synthase n=1 Tax=Desulfosporosinus sp. BICA1-9 TaxID=1531958 RepID=UPI00054B1CB9|nr:NAD(+) synthase [Desulfosporosinus sp. BICA1-9]KJS48053.1 MAG: NAD synthetase [Peptococcaceae bacterium BRH_c23]KJS89730.1 MAG: NAD synthetase [Desulfosporosinus sp. BICA1-9]HBW38153.1 NAD(+) synthase [Desulfosporosinus sp.]
MRNWNEEIKSRVEWIREILNQTGAKGLVIGMSSGKDSNTVAALCKLATDNVLGVIMPCYSRDTDKVDALKVAEKLGIETVEVPLEESFSKLSESIQNSMDETITPMAFANIKPRLRMTTLYALAQAKGYLVAGTDNLSEAVMGYYTKYGDGAYDFCVISDLTATEVVELGKALGIPKEIIEKTPSAGLWEGQTDESEMGITYAAIDEFIRTGEGPNEVISAIRTAYTKTAHKRMLPLVYGEPDFSSL